MVVSGIASIHTYLSWHCLIQDDELLFRLLDYSTVRVCAIQLNKRYYPRLSGNGVRWKQSGVGLAEFLQP